MRADTGMLFGSTWRGLVPCLLLALLLLGGILNATTPVHAESLSSRLDAFGVQQPHVHKPAPDFTLAAADDDQKKLSDYRGKLVLLTFWATWCAPCRHEMPQIEALWQQYRNQGLTVLAVNVNRGNASGVTDFAHSLHLDFPILLDPDGNVRTRYEIRALPTSYFIDRDGTIMGRIIGERDWSSSAAQVMIRAFLKQGEQK